MSSTLAARQMVSQTACDCAAVRAAVYGSTRCAAFDDLAAEMVRGGVSSLKTRFGVLLARLGAAGLTRRIIANTSPGVDVFLFARQMVADDLVRAALAGNSAAQIVILGAGLDTSALRIGRERRAEGLEPGSFFEVDLPATQTEKRRLTARLIRRRKDLSEENIRYVSCSFGGDELGAALRRHGFDPLRPAIWIWSGVIHYLTAGAVGKTLAEIKELTPAGSRLFFDFTILEAYEDPEKYGFARNKERFDAYGEVMSFGFRQGAEHVREWLTARGLNFERIYTDRDMVALYEEKTGRTAPSAGTPWAHLCLAGF